MTGGRLKRLTKYLKDETFLMTYGDGVSNINLKKLLNFHKKIKISLTISAVRPPARFGAIKITGNKVKFFKENLALMRVGLMELVIEPSNYISGDKTFLEKYPFEKAAKNNEKLLHTNTMDFGNAWIPEKEIKIT